MTVCRNSLDNDAMACRCYKFMKVLFAEFLLTYVVLMDAVSSCFNLKPDGFNLATTILVMKLSQLHETLILGKLWLEFL